MSRVDYIFDRRFEQGHNYVVYVTQVNKAGLESEFSDPAFITAGRTEPLQSPTLNIDDCFCDGDDISANVSWTDNQLDEDLDFYRIYVCKGVPTWFNGDGYYDDEFPSNTKTFEVPRDHFDLRLEDLDIDATYTIGIEAVDFYGNVSPTRYVTTFKAEDNSPVASPSNEIRGEAVGYWALQVSTQIPNDPNAEYIQFFRDGITPLPPIDCRPNSSLENGSASIIDNLDYGMGLSHRYTYQIIRFDGKRSAMSGYSNYFTARAITESALDPHIKEQWKEEFTRELEDRINTLESQHRDHDRKIHDLQNAVSRLSDEIRRGIDSCIARIAVLENEFREFKDSVEARFRNINATLQDLQRQINAIRTELANKADISYVDAQINQLNSRLRSFISSELARITDELQAYVRNYTARFALKTYVDQKLSDLDRDLRAYINQLINALRNQLSNDLQDRIHTLTTTTIPSMINTTATDLERTLKQYARDQDAILRRSLTSLIDAAESRCISRCQQMYNNAIGAINNAVNNMRSNIMNDVNRNLTMTNYVNNALNNRLAALQASIVSSVTNSLRSEISSQIERAKTALRNEFDSRFARLQTSLDSVMVGANRYTDSQITLLRIRLEGQMRGLETRIKAIENTVSNLQTQLTNAINSINSMASSASVDASTIYQYCKEWFNHILEEGCSFKGAVHFTDVYISRSLTLYTGATTRGITNQGVTPANQTINRLSNVWEKLRNTRNNQGRMGIINKPISLQLPNQTNFVTVKYTALLAIGYSLASNDQALVQTYSPMRNNWRVFLGRTNENNGGADGRIYWSTTFMSRDFLTSSTSNRIVTNGTNGECVYQNVSYAQLISYLANTSKSVMFCTLTAEWSGTVSRASTNLPLYVFLYADQGAHQSYVQEICVTREVFTVSVV